MGECWAIVVAAGGGNRFGGAKQFASLGRERVVDRSTRVAGEACDGVIVVVPPEDASAEAAIAGGSTRSESVRAGLAAVPAAAEVVCVHDAARPFASAKLWAAVIAAVRAGADGAVPALPVNDTIKVVDGDRVTSTLDRSSLVAVQTPQAFDAAALRAAHGSGREATDDASLVELAGGRVVVVPGDEDNFKITVATDLERARELVATIDEHAGVAP